MFSTASHAPSGKDDCQRGPVPATLASSELVRWFEETQADGLRRGDGLPFWYHGLCSRGEAERLLAGRPVGSYLLRLSQSQGGLVLSYSGLDRCRHFIVQQAGSGHYLVLGDRTQHSSISDLLDHHRKFPISPFSECLTTPCYKRLERCYEEIDTILGRSRLCQDPGGASGQLEGEETTRSLSRDPQQAGAALDGDLGSEGSPTPAASGRRQRPERCYEEIDTVRGRAQHCRDPGGVSSQTEGEEATRPLSRDPQQAGATIDGALGSEGSSTPGASAGRQSPEQHYEEIHEILSRKRSARGAGDPQTEMQTAGGSEAVPGTQVGRGTEVGAQSDGDYQEIGEAKRLAAETVEGLLSSRARALALRPVPMPPRETYAVVNKVKPHVYAEPGEGPGFHTYAEPDEGPWGTRRREPRHHDYTELDWKQARRANYYCPEPTRGSSVAPGSEHKDRPLPEPGGSLRPTVPTFDPTARPLPVSEGSLRPTAPTSDPTARPLLVPEGSMKPMLMTSDPIAWPLPVPEGSLRPTTLTSDPTVQPWRVPDGSLPPTAPTSDPTAQPLPVPEGSLSPTASTSDAKARIPPGPESSPRPGECSFPTYARPVRKHGGRSAPEPAAANQLNEGSMKPALMTSDPTAWPLPIPEGSLRPTASTSDPRARTLPVPKGSLRPTPPSSDPTIRPFPVPEGSLPPTAVTSDPTAQPLHVPEGSLRPTASTSDPTARIPPGPESSPRPSECSFPTYARPVRKHGGQSAPEPAASIQLNDPVYGLLPCPGEPSAAPAPRAAGVKPQPVFSLPRPVPWPPVAQRSPGVGQGPPEGPRGPGCGRPEAGPRAGLKAPGARPRAQVMAQRPGAAPTGRGPAQLRPAPADPATRNPNLYESILDYQQPAPAYRVRKV